MQTGRTNKDRIKPQRRYLSIRKLQLLGGAGLLAYATLATSAAFSITGPTTHPSRELFPFFTWSLFSQVSNARKEYHIAVIALDGQPLDPPVDMRTIDVFPSFSDSRSVGYKALQNLGKSLSKGADDSDIIRERFAARFFGRHDVDYQINRHVYNPLRRWHEGPSSDAIKLIGNFSHEGAS